MALAKILSILLLFVMILLAALPISASTIEVTFSPNDTIAVGEGRDTTANIEFQDTAFIDFTPVVTTRDTTGFATITLTRHEHQVLGVYIRATVAIAPGYAKWGFYGIDFVASDSLNDSITTTLYVNVWDSLPPETLKSYAADSTNMPIRSIRLSWNAPHEDDTLGGAISKYHIRYETNAPGDTIENWWNNADSLPVTPPTPLPPHQQQLVIASGLGEYQPYWFGIRSEDAAGNLSAITVRGPARSRHKPPTISLLGDLPDTVKTDSVMYFMGVAGDSGGALSAIRYSHNRTTWTTVTVDTTCDSSAVFIRKYFYFSQPAGINDSIIIYVRAFDSRDSTTYSYTVRIDRTRPNHPSVTPGQDSLTSGSRFTFDGTKDHDAAIWTIVTIGSTVGSPIRITAPGDTSATWDFSEDIYYQGFVTFAFYATDPVGNFSDTVRFHYFLMPNPPNIIDSVDYHNTTIFNPLTDSFWVSFQVNQVSYFNLHIRDALGAIVYQINDDSIPAGTHSYSWHAIRNQPPNSGAVVPDGRYLAEFSARTYPVSPYDLPITVQLIVDSRAPYLVELAPNSDSNGTAPRTINNQTVFALTVGDTGSVGANTRARITGPYFEYGSSERINFVSSSSTLNRWLADLSTLSPSLPPGNYAMVLVIADSAGNENRYNKYYAVTSETGITDFRNAPNPFAPSLEQTRIVYTLGRAVSDLKLEIFDNAGDLVYQEKLTDNNLMAGNPEVLWDGRSAWGKSLNNGVYFARLTGDITTDFIKIAIVDR
jgi:flagellar hook assembly protein FlgD